MDIITYLEGFYGPKNVLRDEAGLVCVFVDRKTATGVSIPSRYRAMLRDNPDDYQTPFFQHLTEIALGYGEPIEITHHMHGHSKLL